MSTRDFVSLFKRMKNKLSFEWSEGLGDIKISEEFGDRINISGIKVNAKLKIHRETLKS